MLSCARTHDQSGMNEIVALALPGKDGPLGIIAWVSTQHLKYFKRTRRVSGECS